MSTYWKKQSIDNPLFPDIEWEKPERKDLAGKLLIVGGSIGSFHGVAEAFSQSTNTGIGEVTALIPESLKKLTKGLPNIAYAPTNLNGSFSIKSHDTMLYAAQWADGLLLSGEYGRNSETAVVLANIIRNYSGLIAVTKDGVDILKSEMKFLAERKNTLVVCSYSQLQKIGKELHDHTAFKYSDDLMHVVEHLHDLTLRYAWSVITKHGDYLITAHEGEVITTERNDLSEFWCLAIASSAITHLIQHRGKPVPALATALLTELG